MLFGFLMLFVLNTAAFAGSTDPEKDSEKPSINHPRENKLSAEELNRLNRRAETDNLRSSAFSNKVKNDSRENLKAPNQIYIEKSNHHGVYIGVGIIILLVILIVVLV